MIRRKVQVRLRAKVQERLRLSVAGSLPTFSRCLITPIVTDVSLNPRKRQRAAMSELTAQPVVETIAEEVNDRPMGQAMLRGWKRCCPNCGTGPMLQGYLKVREACPVCSEELHHQRADDGPAYLTIVVVGKLLTPLLYWAFIAYRPDPLIMSALFSVGAVAMSLYLLPRLKGMLIGIQWSRRMHGFGRAAD